MKIRKATSWFSTHKTGSLDPSLRVADINRILGFEGEVGDPDKVTNEWLFTVDGVPCGVWDYYGTRWSTFGPRHVLAKVFPGMVD